MCKSCVDKHAATKITASHNMFDIDIEKDIGCKVHPEEMVKYFCENCESCVCVLCTFQEHADHELLSFKEGVEKYKGDMYRLLNKCKSMIHGYTKIAESLQKTEDVIKITEKEIKDTSHAFVAAIRAKEKQMIDELHNVYGQEVMDFIAKRADIDLTLTNLSSTTRLADVIMKGSPMEMLLLKKDVSDKLEDLAELCPPTMPDQISKKVMFIQGSVLLGSLESGAASKTLTAFMDKRPRNREVQTDPIWVHDLTDEDGESVAPSIKVKYVERYQEETQTDPIDTQHMWSQTKEDVEFDDVWCQTGEDDFGFFDDQALWYFNEKQWYQKDLEDESVQTEPIEEEKSNKNCIGENDIKNILNNKMNSDKPKPMMVDTETQIEEAKKNYEAKGVQTMIVDQPLKPKPADKNVQVALVGDPLGMKPKQFADKFSQSEKKVLTDSQVQATEVGDSLWVTPKDFSDAWVKKDMDQNNSPGNVQPSRDGSSVAPPGSSVAPPKQGPQESDKQVTSIKTVKLDMKPEVKTEVKPEVKATAPPTGGNQGQTQTKQVSKIDIPQNQQSLNSGGSQSAENQPTQLPSQPAKVESAQSTSQPKQQQKQSSTSSKPSQKELKRVIKPQSPQVTPGKPEQNSASASETREPLSEAEAFKKAREEMVQAAKSLLDPNVTAAAKTELDKMSSDSDENLGSMSSSTSSIQPTLAQASQANSSSLVPMQAYGPINIPPGTIIRRVQNLPAGAVPIDPSMLPPGMIPMHAKANPNASQGMPKAETAEHGKPRRISDDSGKDVEHEGLERETSSDFVATLPAVDQIDSKDSESMPPQSNPTNIETVETRNDLTKPLTTTNVDTNPALKSSPDSPPVDEKELLPPVPVNENSWYKSKQPSENEAKEGLDGLKEDTCPEWRYLSFHHDGDKSVETIKYRTKEIAIVKGMINNKIELPFHVQAILDPKNRQVLVVDKDQRITIVGRGCLWKPNFITSTDRGNIAIFDLNEKAMKVFDITGNYLAQIDENSSQIMSEN